MPLIPYTFGATAAGRYIRFDTDAAIPTAEITRQAYTNMVQMQLEEKKAAELAAQLEAERVALEQELHEMRIAERDKKELEDQIVAVARAEMQDFVASLQLEF